MQEPEIERHEDQHNANVRRQPRPDVASEEQDVHGDHDTFIATRAEFSGAVLGAADRDRRRASRGDHRIGVAR
jgi:hypothetical protein